MAQRRLGGGLVNRQMTQAAKIPNQLVIEPAIGLLEFSSIAAGILAADAMVKRAELVAIHAGTVQPGRFLILVGGPVAEVEEAIKAGHEAAPSELNDTVFLANVHPEVVRALGGGRTKPVGDALGILETHHVPAAIKAADKGIKGAQVRLLEVRLADGLHGKGLVFFNGIVSDVEAALELATNELQSGQLVRQAIIPQLHTEIMDILIGNTRFGVQLEWNLKYKDYE